MPRPFYSVGHNTNSIREIREGLARGLNAFEIDIHKDENNQLYVSHDPVNVALLLAHGFEIPPRIVPFLAELKQLAASPEGAGMALVIFDSKVAEADLALELLEVTRAELTDGGTSMHVIYSVATVAQARTFFERIQGRIGSREALMIDQEADPGDAARFFRQCNIHRGSYGNGITTLGGIGLPSPFLASQMDVAVAFRCVENLRFVYPWVLVERDTIREFLRIGVNGVMVDTGNAGALAHVLREPEFADVLRLARRDDDPMVTDRSLLLQVATADVAHAGTDATVTFTLELVNGARLSRKVDGAFNGRFERGSVTCVAFTGLALSPEEVAFISVSHDGGRNAPDWSLGSITLRRRGAPDRRVAFDCEITQDAPARRKV